MDNIILFSSSHMLFFSPDGVKVRSKPELQLLVGDALDLSNFNFRLGQFLPTLNGRPNPKVSSVMCGLLIDNSV